MSSILLRNTSQVSKGTASAESGNQFSDPTKMVNASSKQPATLRFAFGKNWHQFLSVLNEDRVLEAEKSLSTKLKLQNFTGLRFLDIGCGSGLFSLAARRLGACVYSFDCDPESVACAQELRKRHFPEDPCWTIASGSALDAEYLKSLGEFDVVYSWGVLHHTGDMWQALENAALPVAPVGKLFISIYNDQGIVSQRWGRIKRLYNRGPFILKGVIETIVFLYLWGGPFIRDVVHLRPLRTLRIWRHYGRDRGMSAWHDLVDWAGGYPFEVAKPEEIFDFFHSRGFQLESLRTCGGGKGCNEFLFLRP